MSSPARSLRSELGACTALALAVDTSQCCRPGGARTCLSRRCHGSQCSRSWHCAVRRSVEPHLSPQPHDTLSSLLAASAAAAAGPTRSPHWPCHPALACATSCRKRLPRCRTTRGRCCPEVAHTRRRPLGLVTRLTPASLMPLQQPPLAAARRLCQADGRRHAPGLRAFAALPPLEPLAAERGLPPLL